MTKGNCSNCVYWEANETNCQIDGKICYAENSCENWISNESKEKPKIANSYVPNPWDSWKKEALKKENLKNKNWEI